MLGGEVLRERPPPHTNYADTSRIIRVQDQRSRPCFDEGQGGQVFDLARVELGLEREVVLIDRFVVQQPGEPQALVEAAVVAAGESQEGPGRGSRGIPCCSRPPAACAR